MPRPDGGMQVIERLYIRDRGKRQRNLRQEEKAKAQLQSLFGWTEEQAYRVLRHTAMMSRRKITVLCDQILSRHRREQMKEVIPAEALVRAGVLCPGS